MVEIRIKLSTIDRSIACGNVSIYIYKNKKSPFNQSGASRKRKTSFFIFILFNEA